MLSTHRVLQRGPKEVAVVFATLPQLKIAEGDGWGELWIEILRPFRQVFLADHAEDAHSYQGRNHVMGCDILKLDCSEGSLLIHTKGNQVDLLEAWCCSADQGREYVHEALGLVGSTVHECWSLPST